MRAPAISLPTTMALYSFIGSAMVLIGLIAGWPIETSFYTENRP